MTAMSATMATVAGSAMTAPATALSSSAAFGTSSGAQQLSAVLAPASFNGARMVAVRASQSSHEEQSGVKSKVLVALVAAGAALALNVAPASPAHAGLFGGDDVKVDRGATAPDFPGNEGTGTKVGDNAGVRGSSNSGTPLGEGSINTGSGVNLGDALSVPSIPSIPNPLEKVGELNPVKGGLPEASGVVGDAKDAVQRKVAGAKDMAENAKSTVNGGLPEAVSSEGAKDMKNAAGEVAKSPAQTAASRSAQEFVEGAKSNNGFPSSLEALLSKIMGN